MPNKKKVQGPMPKSVKSAGTNYTFKPKKKIRNQFLLTHLSGNLNYRVIFH
jgi:hypothetical protein